MATVANEPAWIPVPIDPPEDGWYWHTWSANQEVRICQVVDGIAFDAVSVPWPDFIANEAHWIMPANAPESMAYSDLEGGHD